MTVSIKNVLNTVLNTVELERKGNRLAYETYQNKLENHIRLIELPSLKELDPIHKEEAKKLGLIPQGINQPDGFLKAKTN